MSVARLKPAASLFLSVFCAAAFLVAQEAAIGQIISDTVPEPSNGALTLGRQAAKAGESVNFTLTFDNATTVELKLAIVFRTQNDSMEIDIPLPIGQRQIAGTLIVPGNADGGDYVLNQVFYYDGKRNQSIPVTPVTLHIDPLPKPVQVIPSKAVLVLNLNQRQFIREQAPPIEAIRDTLLKQLGVDSSYSPQLKDALISSLEHADALLPAARDGYIARYEVKPVPILQPVLFEDFHRSYLAGLTELRANNSGAHASVQGASARLILAQLSRRPAPSTPSEKDWLDHPLDGSFPLAAQATLLLLNRNVRAYLLIGESGLDTFSIRLASLPSGATVSYRRIGEDWKPLDKPTDVASAIFPIAMWTFRFEKPNCATIERTPDPYVDAKPEITVEFSCKTR